MSSQRLQLVSNRTHERYVAEPTLRAFHSDDTLVRGIMGPFGSGKSSACCAEILWRACDQLPDPRDHVRRTRWLAIRNTYPELLKNTLETWLEWAPAGYTNTVYGAPITSTVRAELGDGTWLDCEVIFIALDKPKDLRKLDGSEVTGAWANEARYLPLSLINRVRGRLRFPATLEGEPLSGPTWRGIIADTNPPNTRHWWYHHAEQLKPDGWRFWRQPGGLLPDPEHEGKYKYNPLAENLAHLPTDYYFSQLSTDPEFNRVHIEGEYGNVFEGKPVYGTAFRDSVHRSPTPLEIYRGLPLYAGVDFGVAYTAVILGQVGVDGQLRILREIVAPDMGIRPVVIDRLRPMLQTDFAGMQIHTAWCDPAGRARSPRDVKELTLIGEMRSLGINAVEAPTNDFLPRRGAVMDQLCQFTSSGTPRFAIDPSCTLLLEGFGGGYQYRMTSVSGNAGTERYTEEPDKTIHSHPHDGLQYLCLGLNPAVLKTVHRKRIQQPRQTWAAAY